MESFQLFYKDLYQSFYHGWMFFCSNLELGYIAKRLREVKAVSILQAVFIHHNILSFLLKSSERLIDVYARTILTTKHYTLTKKLRVFQKKQHFMMFFRRKCATQKGVHIVIISRHRRSLQ